MTYNPAIPKPADLMSVSQGDLLENFSQLNTQFGVNHVEFDDAGANKGKHKFCSFVEQAADPAVQSDEYIIYSKEDDSGDTELYARPEAGAGNSYQITKDANLYLGLIPVVSVNWDSAGAIFGNSLGVSGGAVTVVTPGRFKVNFTAAVTAQLVDNNYFWSVSGFDDQNNPVIAQVQNTASYTSVVDQSFIIFDFKNQNNSLVTTLTRACAVCWRIQ